MVNGFDHRRVQLFAILEQNQFAAVAEPSSGEILTNAGQWAEVCAFRLAHCVQILAGNFDAIVALGLVIDAVDTKQQVNQRPCHWQNNAQRNPAKRGFGVALVEQDVASGH